MPTVNINGVDLYYEVAGEGRVIALVSGYTGTTQDWVNQIPVLSSKYRVIAHDHRGHGKSAAPSREGQYSIQIFADDVFGLLKTLNVEKCCLVGHSMGGLTALQFALEHQDMLAALVLVDTSSMFAGSLPFGLRNKLDEIARSQGMEATFEYYNAHDPTRMELYKKHPEKKEASRQRYLMTSPDGYINAWEAMEKWEPVTSRLADIEVPTLIYWGDEDLLLAEGCQILKKGIANSELITVKDSGHYPQEDAPDFFNETLLKFLSGVNW